MTSRVARSGMDFKQVGYIVWFPHAVCINISIFVIWYGKKFWWWIAFVYGAVYATHIFDRQDRFCPCLLLNHGVFTLYWQFMVRRDVLSVFRAMMRTTRVIHDKQARLSTRQLIKSSFKKHKNETDLVSPINQGFHYNSLIWFILKYACHI